MKLDNDTREHRIYVLCLDIEREIEDDNISKAKDALKEIMHYFHKGTHYPLSRRWDETDKAPPSIT